MTPDPAGARERLGEAVRWVGETSTIPEGAGALGGLGPPPITARLLAPIAGPKAAFVEPGAAGARAARLVVEWEPRPAGEDYGKVRRLDRSEAVWVLDEDPDLGRGLDGPTRAEVQARAVAPLVRLVPGKADIATLVSAGEDDLGALVLDGLLARTVRLGGRSSIELLGSEDLLRPRDDFVDPPSLRATITWTVMQPTRLAVLDQPFARRIAPWLPAVAPVLLERAVRRARHLTLRVSIVEMKRIEERLLLLLWLLADRWGRMQSDGVCLPLRLTHEVLGRMVCAHRSSVTTALNQLLQKGAVCRVAEGFLLLQDAAGAGLGTSGGATTIPASSGNSQRRRLDRGG